VINNQSEQKEEMGEVTDIYDEKVSDEKPDIFHESEDEE